MFFAAEALLCASRKNAATRATSVLAWHSFLDAEPKKIPLLLRRLISHFVHFAASFLHFHLLVIDSVRAKNLNHLAVHFADAPIYFLPGHM